MESAQGWVTTRRQDSEASGTPGASPPPIPGSKGAGDMQAGSMSPRTGALEAPPARPSALTPQELVSPGTSEDLAHPSQVRPHVARFHLIEENDAHF